MGALLPSACRFGYDAVAEVEEPLRGLSGEGGEGGVPGAGGAPGAGGSNDGGACSGPSAACPECTENEDCESMICEDFVCVDASCSDAVRNQDEEGIDCGGTCDPCIPTACTTVLADSVADFSSTQGQGGWRYGYFTAPDLDSAHFIEMSAFGPVENLGEDGFLVSDEFWTAVAASGMHPNGDTTTAPKTGIEHWAVRRWTSTVSGVLFVQGTLFAFDNSDNGVIARVLVNGEAQAELGAPAMQTEALTFEWLVTTDVGDTVDFVLLPLDSNDLGDSTTFEVQICQ